MSINIGKTMKPNLLNRAVLFGLVISASTANVLAAQAPVVDVSSSPIATQSAGSLTEQLANVERKLDSRNRAQVNIQRQLDDLQTQVNELRGVTELHTHQLSQVLDRQRELYQELDRRVSEALKPASQIPTAIAVNTASVPKGYSDDITENEAYDRALNLVLKDKLYEQAIPEFRSFNKTYPESTYAPNSHYWLGQLLFNKGELKEAEQEFLIVLKKYADSSKRSDALLKLGMVAQQQQNESQAIKYYRQLLKEYPNSTSAQLAKPRLDKLSQ